MWYPESFKEATVAKLLSPHGPNEKELLIETGISKATLHRWKAIYAKGSKQRMPRRQKRTKDWTPEEKLAAITDTATLTDEELGAWCRAKGVHASQLALWKEQFLASVRKGPKVDPEKKALRNQVKDLKRELGRKEKALAETAAILVLKKKLADYFGEDEENT